MQNKDKDRNKKQSKEELKKANMVPTEVKTIVILDKPFPKSRLKTALLYEWKDEDGNVETFGSPITKEQEAYLNQHGIFINEVPDERTGRTLVVNGIRLHWVDEYHLEYWTPGKKEEKVAQAAFYSRVQPYFNALGYNAKGDCKQHYEGEEQKDCFEENLDRNKHLSNQQIMVEVRG